MIGEYQHSIDAKNRLFIPAKFREELGGSFYITKGPDGCIYVCSQEYWTSIEEKLKTFPISKSRNLQRTLFANAAKLEPDAQGRIVIPKKLKEYANLIKDVAIIGVSTHAEIWDLERWRQIDEDELTGDNMMANMDELGF